MLVAWRIVKGGKAREGEARSIVDRESGMGRWAQPSDS